MTFLSDNAKARTFLRPTLFELHLPAVTRWAAWDVPVTARGFVWTPKAVRLLGVSGRVEDPGISGSVEIANEDGSALTAFASAVKGSPVKVWDAWLDPAGGTATSQQETLVVSGLLGAWEAGQDVLTVTIDPLLPWAGVDIPRRPYQLACPFQFKGSLCAYAGADASCDRSAGACQAKGNWAHFGGFGRLDPR